jgi:hypothetical protein
MDPFRDYRQALSAPRRHCPSGGCAVCRSQPALVLTEFTDLIGRAWSPAERDMLSKAARSALL